MNRFTISQLERFSGVKAHTIRIWEQRYNALKPGRSEGNTRFYSDTQLKRLLNIVSLIASDRKVADACSMTDRELTEELQAIRIENETKGNYSPVVNQLLYSGLQYQEVEFNRLLSIWLKKLGFKKTYVDIIYPLIEKLGLLWAESTIIPAQEHYITNLIRQKIIAATEELPVTSENEVWMLFLPEDEFHELGLLVANYLLKSARRKTIYLGANLPLTTLEQAVKETKPEAVLFFSVRNEETDFLETYVNKLGRIQPIKKIFIAKKSLADERIFTNRKVHVITSLNGLEKALN